ncbi:UDP-3-O-(3-hydroxymyristoyl)glucosamine N-acyltransferase [Leptospira santarosai]|uniref:UDP-3-O-(3-hydroxymyristoyl)glucosamine N-acyltransferase n=1 Tax=Leptospira santarosai TaxID=28183 RepID=UPI0024AFA5F7|nr:UDP-3-O-(3-hydroxymyristoyl)glucosamine N-acyltransferase [Leptospira santarosai]MBW9233848.1 UDP-3-O-(3-hydroxymyristoyl)glucosamine N-acyltransferase [Leptospira santarosai]MDI7174477.1 UDP-3-O-(3-hydroxymyristoyl)glucosamine N-acyltransferase [Leptospira santarosai]MDI7193949.1 UDP-3-O-(3-hydroxymyristoyl)glucosamine N-acyltransferase [Leptospira santarosai]MDO6395973.1 UDP-3-O-(3-hydroxymyristoyl)glucosamine N-acyltransferase [Leptospira santarosai]MDO6398529.1 UDP-3-O-(3-hydroxymyristo
MKAKDLAKTLGVILKGNGEMDVKGIGDIENHSNVLPDRIYYFEAKKYLSSNPKVKQVQLALTIPSLADEFPSTLIVPEHDARLKFIELLSLFEKKPKLPAPFISDKASIHESARLGKNVTIMDFAVIQENAEIGDNCQIYPNVTVESGAKIGKNTVLKSGVVIGYNCVLGKHNLIHSNTVIGADGFGFYDKGEMRYKIPQIGNSVIGDYVEMGACCTVDRATIETTSVGNYTKFDDHVHIAHNCRVGNYVYIAGGTVLAGSVTLEDGVIMGGHAAVAEGITMKKGSILMGMSGLGEDSAEKVAYFGIPAKPALEMHRIHSSMSKLPELVREHRNRSKKY